MTLSFPADPAAQTPANTYSPTSTPEATENGVTYIWNGSLWNASSQALPDIWSRFENADDIGTIRPSDVSDRLEVGGDGLCVIGQRVGVGRHPATEDDDAQLQVGGNITATGFIDSGEFSTDDGVRLDEEGTVYIRGDSLPTTAEALGVYRGGTNPANQAISFTYDGSIDVIGRIDADQMIRSGASTSSNFVEIKTEGEGINTRGSITISKNDASSTQRGINFLTNGSTTSFIKYNGSTTFNLEWDDPSQYVTTANEEGEAESVYNGPTLDVKETLLQLMSAMAAINQAANSETTLASLKEAIKTATADFQEAN